MAEPPDPSERSDDPHLSIHRRLCERDPTAPVDLANVFFDPLIDWLTAKNRTLPAADPLPPAFWQDVERIAVRFRIDPDTLAEVVRFGQALRELSKPTISGL